MELHADSKIQLRSLDGVSGKLSLEKHSKFLENKLKIKNPHIFCGGFFFLKKFIFIIIISNYS
jgi:hypothetical protein